MTEERNEEKDEKMINKENRNDGEEEGITHYY
jgi:hypothetical protein